MEKQKKLNINLQEYAMFLALIAIFVIFYFLTGGKNASPFNINNLVMQNSYVVILATGMLLCVLTGNIDLGVGSVVALTGAVSAILVVQKDVPYPIAFLVALLIGLISGMFVGFFVAYIGIPPFVVTLATMLMGRGLTYTLLQAKTVGPLPDNYVKYAAGFVPSIKVPFGDGQIDLVCIGVALVATIFLIIVEMRNIKTRKKYNFAMIPLWQTAVRIVLIAGIVWFFFYKLSRLNGIPIVLIIMAIIVVIYNFICSKTVAGRQIYALGGNAKAARLSGINTKRVFFWVYTNMGLLSAVAGIVLSARNAAATPKAGESFEMDAIASCYIGGAAAAGGVGTIIGALVGAFTMGILNNGMSLMGLSTDIQKVVKGLVLLGAVTFDVLSKNRKK
ncbi:putative multiple sugar transport system permease protein [Aequitasia blattaphilus]|uniref:Xylose transport system permease protein XylH n=1 Tax=Aequitasia blattaphilus TaxID=2949332 RepID=A0ABT1EA20_9FIRM|nr:multiple monosaccharide ABC transporter permease [Aequitasia blattaphilus]MCP1102459.1 sugar ABC transporter permease [Aequitasia blattaphilus]MCR8615099.1 sugar ABC transporter permease [Aequitasia blattaphilus]